MDIRSLQESCNPHYLPQTLDLTEAQGLRDRMLLLLLLGEGGIILDASAVDRMSTPCVQVLLATGHAADSASTGFKIINASDVFQAALADLGLQSEFSNWTI